MISGMKGLNNIIWSPYCVELCIGIPCPANFNCIYGCVFGLTVTSNVFPANVVNSKVVPTIKSNTDIC